MRCLPLFLLLAACSGTATDAGDGRIEPADLAAIDLQPGSSTEQSISLSFRGTFAFILDVPASIDAPVPLVLALPYAGDPVPTARQYHALLARPALADLGAIVVVPVVYDGVWTTPGPVADLADFVEAAASAWPIDPERVVVTGYSNGGNGVWSQAAAHPDLYSAAIPMASFAPTAPPTGVPLYIIHGENDELFSVGRARAAASAARQAGATVEIVTPPYAHFEAGRYVGELAAAVAWVEREVWGR